MDEDRLLIGADRVYLFENEEFSVFQNSPEGMISSMILVSEDNLWVSDNNSGILHWDGSEWTQKAVGMNGQNVAHIALDSSGNLWAAHRNGASKWDGEKWTNYDENSGLIGTPAWGVTVDPMNNVWVGTEYGVSYFDGENWTAWTTDDGLLHNITNAIAVNPRTGEVIAGGYNGMARYVGDIVTTPIKSGSITQSQNIRVKHLNGLTHISLKLENAGEYAFKIFDVKGQVAESRYFNTQSDGRAVVLLNGSPTPGVYITEVLRGNTSVASRKFVL